MSPTFAHDASGASGYVSVAEIARPRVEITILGRPYAKHGTSVAIRLIVFDKGWIGQTERHTVDTIEARGFQRGYLSHAHRGRQRGDGDRRREGYRAADAEAVRGVPPALGADPHLRQQRS